METHTSYQKNYTIKIITLILINLSYFHSFAQKATISGTVTDQKDNSTIIGATVRVKNTTIGTTTDINGKYLIKANSKNDTLIFSFIGYKSEIVALNGKTDISIVLSPDVKVLNDVVVTALGIKREKKSLGYSVSEVSGEQLQTGKDPERSESTHW